MLNKLKGLSIDCMSIYDILIHLASLGVSVMHVRQFLKKKHGCFFQAV